MSNSGEVYVYPMHLHLAGHSFLKELGSWRLRYDIKILSSC